MAKTAHVAQQIKSVDDQLADHLQNAENHLIEALKLFSRKTPPDRHADYVSKLTRVQEGVTTLLRQELVRMRGPIRIKVKK